MKVTVVQPALPTYRLVFFQRLADRLGPGFVVYTSRSDDLGLLETLGARPEWQRDLGPIQHLLPGLEWQSGALSVPISRGDVLVVCGAPRTLSTLALVIKGKLKGARTIWWGHYWSSTSKPWRAVLRFALMRLPDEILFYTDQEVGEYKVRHGGGLSKPVTGLNNGIDTSVIATLRTAYDASARPRDLLLIGRLTAKVELALLVAALARPECAGITLDVIGDGPERAALEKAAQTYAIADRITWHGGTVDEQRIAAVANVCKAFVYPGSVGLSLIHGMAYGLPVIVHDDRFAHMPEIAALEPGVNGMTFRKGNVASLALAVSELLGKYAVLQKMSHEAIALTDRTFNASDMVERFYSAVSASRN